MTEPLPTPRPRGWFGSHRRWVHWVLPLVPIGAAVFVLVTTLDRQPSAAEPPAPEVIDIENVSTERLEDLVESSQDDPKFVRELPGLELVLAERHFSVGAYDRAFGLYADVVENPETRPEQFALALSRIAWIGWLSNDDAVEALGTIDQALRIDPTNAETMYIKGQVLWCGLGVADEAVEMFDAVLRAPDLSDEVRAQVSGDREIAVAGGACR